MPFGMKDRKDELDRHFKIEGIPTVIMLKRGDDQAFCLMEGGRNGREMLSQPPAKLIEQFEAWSARFTIGFLTLISCFHTIIGGGPCGCEICLSAGMLSITLTTRVDDGPSDRAGRAALRSMCSVRGSPTMDCHRPGPSTRMCFARPSHEPWRGEASRGGIARRWADCPP